MGTYTCGQKTKNYKTFIVGAWNVRTLIDQDNSLRPHRRTALISRELDRFKVDIAAISETRLHGEGNLSEIGSNYTFSGRKEIATIPDSIA